MSNPTVYIKDPQAVLDYGWDWTEWLDVAETISSKTVTAATGLTLNSSSMSSTGVLAWVQGGTAGTSYTLACLITTSAGRTDERTLTIRVADR